MNAEEKIKDVLINKFGFLNDSINLPRPRRVSVEVGRDNFEQVFKYLALELKLNHLCTITGLDEAEELAFIYHLTGDSNIVVNLKTRVKKASPVIKTVTHYFPGADIYERELEDLFGAKVEGLPAGNRYPLTDDWPKGEYPLRKDWKLKGGGKDA
jgi:NADH:ubiquinone oxidoreductase subunit C